MITFDGDNFDMQNKNYELEVSWRNFTGADAIDVTPEVVGTISENGRVEELA